MFSSFSKFILQVDIVLSCVVLAVVEKLIEKEFICPCNPDNNLVFCGLVSSSGIIIICLTMLIQFHHYTKLLKKEKEENKEQAKDEEKKKRRNMKICYACIVVLSCCISIFTWLTLWYSEGHYYLCQKSDLDGVWTASDSLKGMPTKWCEPDHSNQTLHKEGIIKSTKLFNYSQRVSIGLFITLALLIVVYIVLLIYVGWQNEEKDQQTENNAERMPLNQQQSDQSEGESLRSPLPSPLPLNQGTGGMQPDVDCAVPEQQALEAQQEGNGDWHTEPSLETGVQNPEGASEASQGTGGMQPDVDCAARDVSPSASPVAELQLEAASAVAVPEQQALEAQQEGNGDWHTEPSLETGVQNPEGASEASQGSGGMQPDVDSAARDVSPSASPVAELQLEAASAVAVPEQQALKAQQEGNGDWHTEPSLETGVQNPEGASEASLQPDVDCAARDVSPSASPVAELQLEAASAVAVPEQQALEAQQEGNGDWHTEPSLETGVQNPEGASEVGMGDGAR
ncbi:hypothetical protein AALO_G00226670 [Alosa alosa]|uniref:Uncharacterized protein n=2 Tax=Alosa alosa TaxID=278164 RepID=A0AAV6G1B4_9TELE|nr:hypothetical protein AALO_G00226670 [Alosa alosa]